MTAPESRCDVLVVGSGGAGMSAAVAACEQGADVPVITKSALGAPNTGRAEGGIQAALGADVPVPIPRGGKVTLKVPPGTANGRTEVSGLSHNDGYLAVYRQKRKFWRDVSFFRYLILGV